MITATAIMGVATVNAQDLKANIPFQFRANNANLPAGEYTINSVGAIGGHIYRVHNIGTRQSVLVLVRSALSSKAGEDPRLVFVCKSEACALSQLWTADAGYQLSTPQGIAHMERASIRIVTLKAD
jgi:hypothetical protein